MLRPSGKLIVLDRDGVINADSDEYVKSPEEWRALPGSLEAIAALNAAGYEVVVATNQSGVGRGLFTTETLERIHARMSDAAAAAGAVIGGVYVCPHKPDDACECRKPLPGLLLRIARERGRTLAGVPVVGDKLTDVLAARAGGARPVFVRSGGRDEDCRRAAELGVEIHDDLRAAVRSLLSE